MLKFVIQLLTATSGLHSIITYSKYNYSVTPIIQINWDREPSGYGEKPDNWIFFEQRLHWQDKWGKKILHTAILGYIFIYVRP
jgi:hypothetical protein